MSVDSKMLRDRDETQGDGNDKDGTDYGEKVIPFSELAVSADNTESEVEEASADNTGHGGKVAKQGNAIAEGHVGDTDAESTAETMQGSASAVAQDAAEATKSQERAPDSMARSTDKPSSAVAGTLREYAGTFDDTLLT